MKSESSEKAQCPCCKEARDVVSETPLLKLEEEIRQRDGDPWRRGAGWLLQIVCGDTVSTDELQWACNACLESGRALPAQPWLQQWCDWNPYFAYFDVSMVCEDCQAPFVFAATEQHFWYETRVFWVQSRPKQCVDCRRKRRAIANENRRRQKEHDARKREAAESLPHP